MEWISVKDSPKIEGKYLTFGTWDGICILEFKFNNWVDNDILYRGDDGSTRIVTEHVTHWQPLPPNPKN